MPEIRSSPTVNQDTQANINTKEATPNIKPVSALIEDTASNINPTTSATDETSSDNKPASKSSKEVEDPRKQFVPWAARVPTPENEPEPDVDKEGYNGVLNSDYDFLAKGGKGLSWEDQILFADWWKKGKVTSVHDFLIQRGHISEVPKGLGGQTSSVPRTHSGNKKLNGGGGGNGGSSSSGSRTHSGNRRSNGEASGSRG